MGHFATRLLPLAGIALLGCETEAVPDETAGEDSAAIALCPAGTPAGLGEPYSSDRGNLYRVVSVPVARGGEGIVLVTWPPAGNTFWADGAAVMVVAGPSHTVDQDWAAHPQSWARPSWGVVEVIAVWPGWRVQDTRAPGAAEGGGPAAAELLSAAVRFATGGLSTEGRPLQDYAPVPICNEQVALLGTSSGGSPLFQAMAATGAEFADHLAGISLFEPPSLPELATVESGAIWMDPDVKTDADGDGLEWNDGRNLGFDPASCTPEGCETDPLTLAWTTEPQLSALWDGYPSDLPPGLLYFDRNGDGAFNIDADKRTDQNGDGRVDEQEDQWARPLFVREGDTYQLYYSEAMRAAAEDLAIVPETATHIASPPGTHSWWTSRSMGRHAGEAGAALPGTAWSVIFAEMPHGPALVERTGETIVFDELTRNGATPTWNFPKDVALCLAGEAYEGYPGQPPESPAPTGADLHAWAVPIGLTNTTTQAIGGLAPLFAARGVPARCPESDE